SQIALFQSWCIDTAQPLNLEKVLELPNSAVADGFQDGIGARQWEVKTTIPRSDDSGDGKMVQVMRPKVGGRISGGGFVAIFRRWPSRGGSTTTPSQVLEEMEQPDNSDEPTVVENPGEDSKA